MTCSPISLPMKHCFTAFVLVACSLFSTAAATDDTTSTPHPRTVLISSGGTDLERAVIKYLSESLNAASVTVTSVALADFPKTPIDSFGVVVVMGAIDKTKLRNPVQQYLERYDRPGQQSTAIIATITGDQWRQKESVVDAVTQASTTLEPKRIATRLYAKIAVLLKLPDSKVH
jgi:hypothetical protein